MAYARGEFGSRVDRVTSGSPRLRHGLAQNTEGLKASCSSGAIILVDWLNGAPIAASTYEADTARIAPLTIWNPYAASFRQRRTQRAGRRIAARPRSVVPFHLLDASRCRRHPHHLIGVEIALRFNPGDPSVHSPEAAFYDGHRQVHLAGDIIDGHVFECPKGFGTFAYGFSLRLL